MDPTAGMSVETRELDQTAARFALKLERLTDRHGIAREVFTVRARRCDDPEGPRSADVYRVCVGLRGFAPAGGVDAFVAGLHKRWQAEGWRITDYRRLETGGLAIGGTDPDTGEEYSWDTGFAVRSGDYVAGNFATPCYRDPGGAVGFGEIPLARLDPHVAERLCGANRDPD